MPDTADADLYVKPFVYETLDSKALHFSICALDRAAWGELMPAFARVADALRRRQAGG